MAADSHPTKRRKKSTSSSSRLNEKHYDKINAAIEHYKRYIGITNSDDDDDEDNEETEEDDDEDECGDIDEIFELIEILSELVDDGIITPFEMSCETGSDDDDVAVNASIFASIHSILPILMSMSYLHIANHSMLAEDIDDDDDQQPPMYYFDLSLRFWPTNPAANSLLADYYRQQIVNTSSDDDHYSIDMATIIDLYAKASTCAGIVKDAALRFFNNTQEEEEKEEEDDDNACFNLKELIDILIISGALGIDMDDQDEEEEMEGEEDDDKAVDSSSTVEETSSFTAAMLLSSLGKHDDAKLLLQKFRFSHRIHPNVWSLASGQALLDNRSKQIIGDATALFQPRMYHSKDGGVLPQEYYDRLCELFAPDAPYWEQSGYDTRGYYSYYFDVKSSKSQGNVVEDAIVNHLLPLAEQTLREEHKSPPPKIVGCEWWIHTRPRAANLGHPLHFDTDEWLLNNNQEVSHPIVSSVLYLTGGEGSGSTIVFDQTPNSRENASRAWLSEPRNNQFMNFPGNLLHGVLPCAGDCNSRGSDSNRLTLMVGFWTRQVTKDIKRREELYVPCGPLPPAIEAHSWVLEAQNIVKKQTSRRTSLEATTLKVTSPAWETIYYSHFKDEKVSLQVPKQLDHQYFVRNAPKCFSDKLFRSHK